MSIASLDSGERLELRIPDCFVYSGPMNLVTDIPLLPVFNVGWRRFIEGYEMKKRRVICGLLILFVLIQLIPLKRSNPPIEKEVPTPPELRAIFHRACYNCHSNETVWPWYSYLAPVSWLVAQDVSEAREKMNFTAWNRLDRQKVAERIKDIGEKVANGDMPPWYYQIVHPEAHLSTEDKKRILEWSLRMVRGE